MKRRKYSLLCTRTKKKKSVFTLVQVENDNEGHIVSHLSSLSPSLYPTLNIYIPLLYGFSFLVKDYRKYNIINGISTSEFRRKQIKKSRRCKFL